MSTDAAPTGMFANAKAIQSFISKSGTIVNNLRIALQSYQNADKSNDSAKLNAAVALLNGLIDQFNAAFPTTGGRERRVNGGAESDVYGAAEGCMCNAIYGSSAIGDIDDLRSKKGGDDMDIINSAHMNAIIDTFEKVGVKFRNKQSIQAITADIESVLPCNGKHPFNNNLAAQPAIVRTIATAVNTFVRAHSKVDFDIVNTGDSATPETMLSELCDWVGTFNVGMFAQRSIVERIVTRLVEDMNSAFALMEHAYNKLARIDCKKKDEIALLRAYYESARDSYKKSSQIFQNYLNIKPQEFKTQEGIKSIEGELFRNGRISVKISTEKFGDAISYLLNLMKSNVELAAELNEQLTKLGVTLSVSEIEGMSMSQYNDSVIDKLPQLTRNSSAEEIKNFELSRKNLLALYTAIKNNAAAAKTSSAQRNMVKGRGEYDDTVSGGYAIEGQVKTQTVLSAENTEKGLLIIREYGSAIQSKYTKFYENVIVLIASVTKVDQTVNFNELNSILTNLADLLKSSKGNIDKELLNISGIKAEHQSKKQYITAINMLINVFKKLSQNYSNVDFKPTIDSLLAIEPTIEHYCVRLAAQNLSFNETQVSSYLMTNNEFITDAINHLKYKVYLHNMGLSLLKVSKTYESYSEKYTETMGRAISSCITGFKKRLTSNYDKVKDNDTIKAELLKADKVITNFYKAVQAVDLYILKTNRQIAKNVNQHIDVFKLLNDAKMISQWYDSDVGNKIRALLEYESTIQNDAFYTDKYDKVARGAEYKPLDKLPLSTPNSAEIIAALKSHNNDIFDKFQALKNIISIFSRITVLDSNSDIFMNPAQIYSALTEFIKFVNFTYTVTAAPAVDAFTLTDCSTKLYGTELGLLSSAIGAMTSSIVTTLNLYELQNSHSTKPCEIMKTRMILGGGLLDDFKIIPEATKYYFRLLRLAEFYKIAFYDYELQSSAVEFTRTAAISADDPVYLNSVESIKEQIKTKLSTNIDIGTYTNVVFDANTLRAMESYLEDVKQGRTETYRISMVSELDGIFQELNSFIAFNDAEEGNYTDADINKIVVIINKIYNHYTSKTDGSIEMAVSDYIEQVNRKFSLFAIEEYNNVKRNNKSKLLDATDFVSSINNNYSILQGETELRANDGLNIFAPSDNYKSSSAASDSSTYDLAAVKKAITVFNERFSNLLSKCNNTTTYGSLLLYTEMELKKSQSDDVKYELLKSIIKNAGVDKNNVIDSYIYHETVRTGKAILNTFKNVPVKNVTTKTINDVDPTFNIISLCRFYEMAVAQGLIKGYAVNKSKTEIPMFDKFLKRDTTATAAFVDELFNTKNKNKFDEYRDEYNKFKDLAIKKLEEISERQKIINALCEHMNLMTYHAAAFVALVTAIDTDVAGTTGLTRTAVQGAITMGTPSVNTKIFNEYEKSFVAADKDTTLFRFFKSKTIFDLLVNTKSTVLTPNKYDDTTDISYAIVYNVLYNQTSLLSTIIGLQLTGGNLEKTITMKDISNSVKSAIVNEPKYIPTAGTSGALDSNTPPSAKNTTKYMYSKIPVLCFTYLYPSYTLNDNITEKEYLNINTDAEDNIGVDFSDFSVNLDPMFNTYNINAYIDENPSITIDKVAKNLALNLNYNCYETDAARLIKESILVKNLYNIDALTSNQCSLVLNQRISNYIKTDVFVKSNELTITSNLDKVRENVIEGLNYMYPILSPFISPSIIADDFKEFNRSDNRINNIKITYSDVNYNELFESCIGTTTTPFKAEGNSDQWWFIPLIMKNKPNKLINQLNYTITEYLNIISENAISSGGLQLKSLYLPALTYLKSDVLKPYDVEFSLRHQPISDGKFIDSRFISLINHYMLAKQNTNTYVTNLLSDISSSCKATIKSQFPRLLNQLKKYKKMASIYKTIFDRKTINIQNTRVRKFLGISKYTIDYITNLDFISLVKILDDFAETIDSMEEETVGKVEVLKSIVTTNKVEIKHICDASEIKYNINTQQTVINSTDTLFTNIETFCSNFISCIERVIKEIADTNPVYMELTENSLDYHIINKNSSPVMPISAALLNTEDSKYLYATRHINCGTSKIKPIHVPSTLKTLASFSAVHNSLITFSEVEMLNFVNYLFDAVRVLKDLGITFNMKGLVYSKEPEFTRITDKIFNDNTIMQYISDFLLEHDKKQQVGRINELISSFIEMNVVPININSLMQSVPLINTLNYSSGFNDLIASHPSMTAIQKDLIINTYIQADFNNSKYQYACAEWLVKDINKPKFVFDEIYTKCLLQSKEPSILANTKEPNEKQLELIKKAGDAIYILLHAAHVVTGDDIGKYVKGFTSAMAAAAGTGFITDGNRQRYMQAAAGTAVTLAGLNGGTAKITYKRDAGAPVTTMEMQAKCKNISTLCALLYYLENTSFLKNDNLISVSTPNQVLSNAVLYISKYIDKEIKYTIIQKAVDHVGVVRVGARLQTTTNKGDVTNVANERYNTVVIRSLLYLSEIQRFINTELNAKLSIGKTSIINSLSLLGNNTVIEKQLNNSSVLNN